MNAGFCFPEWMDTGGLHTPPFYFKKDICIVGTIHDICLSNSLVPGGVGAASDGARV